MFWACAEFVTGSSRSLVRRWFKNKTPIEIASEDQSFNDTEPDIAVLRQSVESYREQAPRAADVLLLIEISDATLSLGSPTTGRWMYEDGGFLSTANPEARATALF